MAAAVPATPATLSIANVALPGGAEHAQPLPGVFVQEAQGGVESGAAPGFEGPVTDLVQRGGDRQHVGGAHAGGYEALVRVAQHGFGNRDRSCHTRGSSLRSGRGGAPNWFIHGLFG